MTSTSNKFDMSSSSPKKPLYANGNGQRGSRVAGSMNRSASFRDKSENPVLSSPPSMSRNTSTPKQGDVTDFLQCLRVDPQAMSSEYKFNRHGDFKKLANDALNSPNASPDDLKKLKAALRESTIKGRERVKIFSESLSAVDKCFPNIPTKKRSRPNGLSGVSRMGPPNDIDVDQQKAEERGINTAPNKRTRTSMVDVRPNTPARSSVSVEKDREALRGHTSNGSHGEDRASPIVADGWEKAKMKKKRSVIKADAASSPSSVSSKSNDGYRETKQGIYPRNLPNSRSRPSDTLGSRPGAASISANSSTPKPEQESKNIRADNKIGVREEYTAGGPTNAKLHAPARGPRSGSMVVPRFSTVAQRATASNDLELPNTASKNGGPVGPTNRKRTLPARSPSPPVTQWADRRPQKITRTARRTNIVPVVPSNDDIPSLDSGTENGSGLARRVLVNSQSSTSSEIKESGATKVGQNVQKVSNLVLPTRKKKLVNGNDRKTGRGVATARFSAPVGIPKQLSPAKLSSDKPKSVHSKPARPHSRRLSDRKANSRQKPTSVDPAVYSPFWNQIEPLFSLPSDTDISYLQQQGSIESVVPTTKPDVDSSGDIPLCQRLLVAFIPEDGDDNENDDTESNGYGSTSEDETDIKSNGFMEFSGLDPFNGYGKKSPRRSHNELVCSVSDYHTMSMDSRILLELQGIGLSPKVMPTVVQNKHDDIDALINDLGKKHHEQVSRKTSVLDKLLKTTTEAKALQEKESEQDSVDKHTVLAYEKYMSCYGPNAPGGKSAGSKLAKQAALANVKQTLERCQEFETTGKSGFTESLFEEADAPRLVDLTDDDAKGKRSLSSNKANDEIKAKTKISQNSTPVSASINGPHGKISDQDKPTTSSVPKLEIKSNNSFKENVEDEEPPLDFSHLEIPEMDVLGDSFGVQGQDLSSWLNLDDEVLQDDDFMGLEIPMDDLSDIKMTV
ncbi:hypothetical protein CTI12_AA281010 [Artemisia annua]|uniref:Uncharacterized protein n=1 Tax=Artemisia annua TaxID=35608 RepID=A0A2U1N8J7_ARTAN|nr:hypothetical protein CTI12_AA281010 [Artemisia annua]